MVNKKRSDLFNEVAEIYDDARPGYPIELIEDVIKLPNLQEAVLRNKSYGYILVFG